MSNLRKRLEKLAEEDTKRNFDGVNQQVKAVIASIDNIIKSNSGAYTDILAATQNILAAYDPNEYVGPENVKSKINSIL